MKDKKDIMHVIERHNRFGELRFECHCSGKQPKTRKNIVYVKTFPVPPELKNKKDIAAYRLQVQIQFKDEVQALSTGKAIKPQKILFADFANECAQRIIERNSESYNYYVKFKNSVVTINSQLGNYYLHELNQEIIDNFLLWLSQRKFIKETVTVKSSLKPLIKAQALKLITVVKSIGISCNALSEALTIGRRVRLSTAEKLCKFLNVSLHDYYDIRTEEIQYAKSVNQGVRTILHYILKKAANKGYIPRNFASKSYAENVSGRATAKKAIYNSRESILEFDRCIDKEQNPEIKIACALYLHLGIRGCEAAALEFKDFCLKNPTDSEVHISRNSIYTSLSGVRTKDVKTTAAERTIILTERLYYLILEYREWWKENIGKFWNTDRLFVTRNGTNRQPQILREWVAKFEAKNNLTYVPPHSLRKTNISLAGMIHAPQKAVQNRSGHAHYTTTADYYDMGTKDGNQEAADLLNEFFKSNDTKKHSI